MRYINRLFTYLLTYLAMMHEGTILLCVTSHHFRGVLHEYMSNNRHMCILTGNNCHMSTT